MDIDALSNFVNGEIQKLKFLNDAKDYLADLQGLEQYKKENQKEIDSLKKEKIKILSDNEKEQQSFGKIRSDFYGEIEKIKNNAKSDAEKIKSEAISAAEQLIENAKNSKVVSEITAQEKELEKITVASINAGNNLANLEEKIKTRQIVLDQVNSNIEKTKKLLG